MKLALSLLVLLILVVGAYVRLAPSNPKLWHAFPENADPRTPDYATANSFLVHRSLPGAPTEILAALHDTITTTPRTRVLAGDINSGMITYVTRSALWGFPDYTTVVASADDKGETYLIIHGRARFGSSDLGVNRARVLGWLAAIETTPSA